MPRPHCCSPNLCPSRTATNHQGRQGLQCHQVGSCATTSCHRRSALPASPRSVPSMLHPQPLPLPSLLPPPLCTPCDPAPRPAHFCIPGLCPCPRNAQNPSESRAAAVIALQSLRPEAPAAVPLTAASPASVPALRMHRSQSRVLPLPPQCPPLINPLPSLLHPQPLSLPSECAEAGVACCRCRVRRRRPPHAPVRALALQPVRRGEQMAPAGARVQLLGGHRAAGRIFRRRG